MSRMPGTLLSLALAAMLATSSRSAQAPGRVEDPGPLRIDSTLGRYDGGRSCQRCHSAPLPGDDTDYAALTEFKTWSEKDRHSRAFATLKNELSIHIGKLLGMEPTASNLCLNCHANNVPKEARAATFTTLEGGVSCEVCHGPSEKWDGPHRSPDWRIKPMAEKEKLGFADVRDVVKQAKLCASCHIGDIRQGRFITHEMYAAGHPPLPGFESATFCDAMPRHWRHLKEKKKPIQELLAKQLQVEVDEFPQTRRVLVGGAVVLGESLRLLADQADGKRPWPELANYDCYACHHDLKSASWQQRSEWQVGVAGRPQIPRWPEILAGVGSDFLGGKPEALRLQMAPLRDALSVQPFGRRELIQQHAGTAWTEEQAARVARIKLDKDSVRRLHLQLLALPERGAIDHGSAKQLTWAVGILYRERFAFADESESHTHFELQLANLDTYLGLRPKDVQHARLAQDPFELRRLKVYDPEELRDLYRRLKAALPEK